MNVVWIIVGVLYLGLVTVAVGLSTWHAFRPRVSSEERLAGHIPDPRDTEIVFLRAQVAELTRLLHGTTTAQAESMADMLRTALVGPTATPTIGIVDDHAPATTVDPIDDDEHDWTDDFLPDDAGLPIVQPPPAGFPTP